MSTAAIPAPASSAPAATPAPSAAPVASPAATTSPSGGGESGGGPVDVGSVIDSWFDEAPQAPAATEAPPAEAASSGDSPEFLQALEEVTGEASAQPTPAAAEKPPAPIAPPPAPPDPQAAALDEDGVVIEAGGRKVTYFSEARAEHIRGQARVAHDVAQALGVEALMPEVANELLNDSRTLIDLHEKLCEPGQPQEKALQYMLSEAMAAYNKGVISVDPSEGLGQSFLAAAERVAPRVAESIKAQVTGNLVADLYDRARKAVGTGAETGALALAQRLDIALNGRHKSKADLLAAPKADDPNVAMTRREEDVARREAAIEDRKLSEFRDTLTAQRTRTTAEEIESQLAPIQDKLNGLPPETASEIRSTLNARLRQEISQQLKADQAFNDNMNRLWHKAKNARDQGYRGQIATQMNSTFKLRVQQVLRTSAPKITAALTAGFVTSNGQRHQQIVTSQRQVATAPVPAGPVPTTVPPRTSGGEYLNADQVADLIDKIL